MALGSFVGSADGTTVAGACVGLPGSGDGTAVGAALGSAVVGAADGCALGSVVGEAEGRAVGCDEQGTAVVTEYVGDTTTDSTTLLTM